MHDASLAMLGFALRARKTVVGREACRGAAQAGVLYALVVAADAGTSAARDVGAAAGVPVVRLELDRRALGALVGRASVAVLGITDRNLAAGLVRAAGPDPVR